MAKRQRIEVDLKNLEFALKLEPIARYPDGTWGAKATIVVNGLPWCASDAFPPINKQFFLLIKNGKAEIIEAEAKHK